MMQLLLVLSVSFGASAQGATRPVNQLIREVVLDPQAKVHKIDIVGWPNLTTAIKFPDTFEAANVLCGQCDDLSDATSAAAAGHADRNWIIEKRVSEHAIHVRPANLPGPQNPPAAFATNIYVGLDGGHTVNLSLQLLQPAAAAQTLNADAVVTLHLIGDATLTGKLTEARRRIYDDFDKQVSHKGVQMMLGYLRGKVICRNIAWRRPYRTDKAVVRLNQLCATDSDAPTFWVTFEVENRSDTKLYLDEAMLEPEGLAAVAPNTAQSQLTRTTLEFGESTTGIALCGLQAQSTLPSSWRLRISPLSAEHKTIEVSDLTF